MRILIDLKMSSRSTIPSDLTSRAGPDTASLPAIACPYLLCLNVNCYRDSDGRRYFDPLWHRDLLEHARYLKNLTLASPCQVGAVPPDAIAAAPALEALRYVDLPATSTLAACILAMPRIAARLWREIGRSSIVHVGIAGWPIPFGWVAGPLALLRRKPYLVIVESAPWRIVPGTHANTIRRCGAWIAETFGRWCVNHARLVIATQEQYAATLLTRNPREAHVIAASWVNGDDAISESEFQALWRAKRSAGKARLKVLFAGRLLAAKGVRLLLDTMRQMDGGHEAVQLDILGEGELLEECRSAAHALHGAASIRILGVVPYGAAFFRLLRDYHAVVVPNLSDEQPRIVYDAWSQGVPVLAGDTSGMRACVDDGRTGLFASSPDGDAWAGLLRWSAQHMTELESMGMEGLRTARAVTHGRMHDERGRLLLELVAADEHR